MANIYYAILEFLSITIY